MTVVKPGHEYEANNIESGSQNIKFIEKEAQADGSLKTIQDGTTNEALIEILIDRLIFLNETMQSKYNENAIDALREALVQLKARTVDRINRGVENTHNQ